MTRRKHFDHFIFSFFIALLIYVPTGLRAQTSPPTTALELWVRADAGVTTNATGFVEKWADQSGKLNDAIQVDDTLKPKLVGGVVNGKPTIRFDGTNDYMDVTSAAGLDITGDIASFAVIRVDNYVNYNSIWGKTSGNLPGPNDWYLIQGTGLPQLFRGDGTSGQLQNVQGQRAIRTNSYVVVGFRQSGTALTHFLNGSTNGVGEITISPADTGTNLKIGSRDDLFTKMKGDIAELLIYSSSLSDAEINTVQNYLRNKYGIVNAAPTVSISAPANNSTVAAPTTVNVTVNAADSDGVISRVSLFANGNAVGTATAAPFRFPLVFESPGQVVLSAVATDDRDAVTTSSSVTVTVTSAATPSLNANPNLKLWLRADAGTTVGPAGGVTKWVDQSGNNNNAEQLDELQAPTVGSLNGKPALRFDGEDDYLDVADSDSLSITGDLTTFVVARFEDFAGFRAVWGKTAGNQPRPADYYLASGSGIPSFLRGYTTNDTENINQGVNGSGRVPANTPVLLGVQQSGNIVTHYLNSDTFGTGAITLTAQDMDTPLKIGTRDDFVTRMKGEIAELLIYSSGLSSNDLANVRQYLAAKYSLPLVRLSSTPPLVQITVPVPNASATAGSISITATASDSDGSVTRVDFFANGTAIGSDTTSPYNAKFEAIFNGAVSLTAVATDNFGNKTTSAAVIVNITGGQSAPIPTGGLVLWLRPDQGVKTNASGGVIQWQDSSGQKNDAVQNDEISTPTLIPNAINGLTTLNFDGVDDYLEVADSPSIAVAGDVTSFFVVNVIDFGTFRAIWAKTAGNLPAANDYYLLPGSGLPRYYHGNGTGGGIAQVTGTDPFPEGEFVTAGFELAGTTATHYLNGLENGSGPLTPAGADTGSPLRIGTRGDFVTRFQGEFAELLIYSRALTENERNEIETYFQSKYFGIAPPIQATLSVTKASNNTLTFSWPEAAAGFTLEASNSVGAAASWSNVTEPVVTANGTNTVTVTASGGARFFRLRKD